MRRRTFLQTLSGASLRGLRASAAPIRLGYDTYSIRGFRWKSVQLLDYAASLKLDTIQLSSLGDYESLEPSHLEKVKEQAHRLGLSIDGGIGCICPTSAGWSPKQGDPVQYVLLGLRVARAAGATVMRCFLGSGEDRRGTLPIAAHMEATIKVLRPVRAQALDAGVKIALENHAGDLQAREVKTIIEEAGKDFVGACLDSGNSIWAVEDPLVTLEVLGPCVVTTHYRDAVVYEHPRGAAGQWVALGDGSIDLARLVARHRELCPQAAMQLEIITGRPPQILPYLEPGFWKIFPGTPAAEFVRFAALARNGHPFMGSMMIAGPGKQPPEFQAALKEQQRRDLERSLEYAKKTLDAGIRWRA